MKVLQEDLYQQAAEDVVAARTTRIQSLRPARARDKDRNSINLEEIWHKRVERARKQQVIADVNWRKRVETAKQVIAGAKEKYMCYYRDT